jgi:hypothetical protein
LYAVTLKHLEIHCEGRNLNLFLLRTMMMSWLVAVLLCCLLLAATPASSFDRLGGFEGAHTRDPAL